MDGVTAVHWTSDQEAAFCATSGTRAAANVGRGPNKTHRTLSKEQLLALPCDQPNTEKTSSPALIVPSQWCDWTLCMFISGCSTFSNKPSFHLIYTSQLEAFNSTTSLTQPVRKLRQPVAVSYPYINIDQQSKCRQR